MIFVMRLFFLTILCAATGFAVSVPAHAWQPPVAMQNDRPLSEQRIRQAEEDQLDREVAYTASQCGASMRASINWNRSSGWPNAGQGLARACDGALGAVEALCRAGMADRVRSRIKSFQCSGDGSGPALSGSTLRYGARPGGNGFGETRAYLEGAL